MKFFDRALLLSLLIYVLIRFPAWMDRQEDIADGEALIQKFEKTIFEGEFDTSIPLARRWERDVVVGLTGKLSAHYLPFVTEMAGDLARITDRNVRVVDLGATYTIQTFLATKRLPEPPEPNFIVFLAPFKGLAETVSFIPGAKQQIESRKPTGYGARGGMDEEVTMAFAAVSDDFPEPYVRNTLLEEISQGFGPINDTEIVQPSIWSDTGPEVDRLPLNDQIILRALYDPAIRPGMPKDEAMAVVRELIPHLVEAVKRDGEKALYQR